MGLLDAFDSLIPTGGKKSRTLVAAGEPALATLVGIRVIERSETADRWHFALDVHGTAGTFRAGCQQTLGVDAARGATIGAQIPVRHDGEHVIIAEAAWFGNEAGAAARDGNTRWKAVTPPPPGIDDDRMRKHQNAVAAATPVTVTVVSVDPTDWEERWALVVQVDGGDGAPTRVTGRVPHYGARRTVQGARLPAGLASDATVLIDWYALAVGPAPERLAPLGPPAVSCPERQAAAPTPAVVPYEFESKAAAKEFQSWLKLRVMHSSGLPAASLSSAMKRFKVDAVSWADLDAKWTERCRNNANLAEQLRIAGG